MNEFKDETIPIAAISKGRNFEDVLRKCMEYFEKAKREVSTTGKDEHQILSGTMMGTAYRLYLLGVEDGMKGE